MSVLIVILLLHVAAAVLIVLTLGIKMRPEKQGIRSRSATTTDQSSDNEEKKEEPAHSAGDSPVTDSAENTSPQTRSDVRPATAPSQTLEVPPLEPIELRADPLPLQRPPSEPDPMPAEEDAISTEGVARSDLPLPDVPPAPAEQPESTSERGHTADKTEESESWTAAAGPGAEEPPIAAVQSEAAGSPSVEPGPGESISAESGSGAAIPATSTWSSAPTSTSADSDTPPGAAGQESKAAAVAEAQPLEDAGPITPASPMTRDAPPSSPTTTPADAASELGASGMSEPSQPSAAPLRTSSTSGWLRSRVSRQTPQSGETGPLTKDPAEDEERSDPATDVSSSEARVTDAGSTATPQEDEQASSQAGSHLDALRRRVNEQIPTIEPPAPITPSIPTATPQADSSAAPAPFFDLDAKPAEEKAASRGFWPSKTESTKPDSPPQTSEDLEAKLQALLKPKADPGRVQDTAQSLSATSAYEAASRVEPAPKPIDNLIPDVIPRGVKISRWRGSLPLGMGRSITRLVLAIMLFSVVLSLLAVLAVSWLGSIMRGIAG